MSQRLNIGYLVPQFPGQTHIFFWREIMALEDMGHSVHVLSTRKPPVGLIAHNWSAGAIERTTYLANFDPVKGLTAAAQLTAQGLPLWVLKEGLTFAKDAAVSIPAAKALVAYAKEHNLDHIHVHSCGRAALVAAFAEKMGGPSYSITLHGPLSDYGSGQRFKWSNASFATVITHKLQGEIETQLAGSLPEKMAIRPMGVDTNVLRRTTPYERPETGRPIRIFSCGRLNVVKGHQDLMTAMRQLIDGGVDIRLEIAGEDDDGGSGYRKELEAHLKTLRLQDHVKLLGAIDADDVKEKLLDAHIFALASWHEPLGVAYMEAMACGVPVIATDAGGVPELITDGHTGELVPPKNPSALARAIRELVNNPDTLTKLSAAGRAHVEAHFHSGLGAETIVQLTQETLAQKVAASTT